MNQQAIQNEWKMLIFESTQNKPEIEGAYPPSIVRNRELLLLGQIELGKIESGKDIKFHTEIYQSVMDYYFHQKNA